MIALWIILGVLCLILLLANIKIRVIGEFCEILRLYVKVGPFVIYLVNGSWISSLLTDHSKKDKWKAKRAKKRQKESPNSSGAETQNKLSRQDLLAVLNQIKKMVVELLKFAKSFISLEELVIRFLAATDDAAKTAELYGGACAMLSQIDSAVSMIPLSRKKTDKIVLKAECDFIADMPEIDFCLQISLLLWQGVRIWLWYNKESIKLWEAQEGHTNSIERRNDSGNIHEAAS